MPRHASYVPHGVIPAVLLPFHDDLSIDEASFRSHLRDVGATEDFGDHPERALHRGGLLLVRRAAPRAGDRAGRDRRPAADRQRHLGRRQPRGGAHRQDGCRWRRLGAAGVPAGAVHAAAVAGDGARPLQAHRRRVRPADHRVPVSAGDRPGLSARHPAEDVRAGALDPRHQGLVRQRAPARDAHPHPAEPAAAGERAHHPFGLAVLVAGARLQRAALRLRQRDRRPAGAALPRRAEERPRGGSGR